MYYTNRAIPHLPLLDTGSLPTRSHKLSVGIRVSQESHTGNLSLHIRSQRAVKRNSNRHINNDKFLLQLQRPRCDCGTGQDVQWQTSYTGTGRKVFTEYLFTIHFSRPSDAPAALHLQCCSKKLLRTKARSPCIFSSWSKCTVFAVSRFPITINCSLTFVHVYNGNGGIDNKYKSNKSRSTRC